MSSRTTQLFNSAGRDDAVNVARLLREASATEVNALNAHYTFVNLQRHEWTALMVAAESGFTQTVRALLNDRRVDVNKTDDTGCSALIWAAHNGHTTTVYALLEKDGIDVNVQSEYGNTALMLGSANGHTEIVRALLEHDSIDVSIRNNALTRVYGAASQNAEEMASNSAIKELFRIHGVPRPTQAVRVLPEEAATAVHTAVASSTAVYTVPEGHITALAAPAMYSDEMYTALEARNMRLMAQITAMQSALDAKDNAIDALQRQVTQLQTQLGGANVFAWPYPN